MLKIRNRPAAWPESLKPKGHGGFALKAFEPWHSRHAKSLAHLHPLIVEQWVHRHWTYSPYAFLSLAQLSWTLASWSTASILSAVHMPGWVLEPVADYKVFTKGPFGPHPTALPLLSGGTWDFPIIVLHTPRGEAAEHQEVFELYWPGAS